MKLVNSNSLREKFIKVLFEQFANSEDVGMIASNSFNFPVCSDDGEEGWCEIVVKITKDTGDDGYMKREQYDDKVRASKERAKAKAEKLAKANAKKAES